MTGSLAPPPPYGSEQGSILLEAGGNEPRQQQPQYNHAPRHGRTRSRYAPVAGGPTSPGPVRSPTDISLAQLVHVSSNEDVGEGPSQGLGADSDTTGLGIQQRDSSQTSAQHPPTHVTISQQELSVPPPEYTSPQYSTYNQSDSSSSYSSRARPISPRPPAPSYDVATGQTPEPDISAEIAQATRETHGGDQRS